MLDGTIIDFIPLRTNYLEFCNKIIVLETFENSKKNSSCWSLCLSSLPQCTKNVIFSFLLRRPHSKAWNYTKKLYNNTFPEIFWILLELLFHPNKHLPVKIQRKKHYKNINSMLKFNNKDISTKSMTSL